MLYPDLRANSKCVCVIQRQERFSDCTALLELEKKVCVCLSSSLIKLRVRSLLHITCVRLSEIQPSVAVSQENKIGHALRMRGLRTVWALTSQLVPVMLAHVCGRGQKALSSEWVMLPRDAAWATVRTDAPCCASHCSEKPCAVLQSHWLEAAVWWEALAGGWELTGDQIGKINGEKIYGEIYVVYGLEWCNLSCSVG